MIAALLGLLFHVAVADCGCLHDIASRGRAFGKALEPLILAEDGVLFQLFDEVGDLGNV